VKMLAFALFPDIRKSLESAFLKDTQAFSFCPFGKINI